MSHQIQPTGAASAGSGGAAPAAPAGTPGSGAVAPSALAGNVALPSTPTPHLVPDRNLLAQEPFGKQLRRYFFRELFTDRIEGTPEDQARHTKFMTLAGGIGLLLPVAISFIIAVIAAVSLQKAILPWGLIGLAVAGALTNMFVDLATDQMKSESPRVHAFLTGFASVSALPLLGFAAFGFEPKFLGG